ncbi:hypothetical protein NHQ30_000624 [Ciborinia camelliae]|nr:hypothetical protein NHQ30_000624 [Ciborinia camelliae]
MVPQYSVFETELCVGCILWLPEQVEGGESVKCILPRCRCNNTELNKEGYKHYVVILDTFQPDDEGIKCFIAMLNSQEGNGKYVNDRIKILHEPSASTPDEHELRNELYLENGSMPKQSYISLSHAFQISPSLLRPVHKCKHAYYRRLSEQSYINLMGRLGLKAALYEDTTSVKQFRATIRPTRPDTPLPISDGKIIGTRVSQNASSAITPMPQNPVLEQQNQDHEALRMAFTLSSQPQSSETGRLAPQPLPNNSTRSTDLQIDAYRNQLAQRAASERDSLIQRDAARRTEFEPIRARDLESWPGSNGRPGPGPGPGPLSRYVQYLLGMVTYVGENTPWKKLFWGSGMVILYQLGIQIRNFGIKGLGRWLKSFVLWSGATIVDILKILGTGLKSLVLWVGGGILELLKKRVRYLGFG